MCEINLTCEHLVELCSSELMLVDDNCLVLGREEAVASNHSPMAGSRSLGSHAHNTYVHSTQNHMMLQGTYGQKQTAAQFVEYRQGVPYTLPPEYFPPRVGQHPTGEQHPSHLQRNHMQLPLCVPKEYSNQSQGHSAQQSVGQHQHQLHGQQQVQQSYDHHPREQQPVDRRQVQQPLDQQHRMEQPFDHHHQEQQLTVDQHQQGQQPVDQHHRIQQHAVSQHHQLQQPADQQHRLQQLAEQQHQLQQPADQHCQLQQPADQHRQLQQSTEHCHQLQQSADQHHQLQQPATQHQQAQQSFDHHQLLQRVDHHHRLQQPVDHQHHAHQPVDQHRQVQEVKPQSQGRLLQMLTRPTETSQSSSTPGQNQHCGNGSQQSFQSQQSYSRQQSHHLTAHNPLQSPDHDAKYAYQQHGQGIGSDQHALQQQQQHAYSEQQTYSEQHAYSEQQQSLPSRHQPFYAAVHPGYGNDQHEHLQKHRNEVPEPKSQQDHNPQEHPLQPSSQSLHQVLLQSSTPLPQHSPQVFLIHSPQVSMQSSPQMSLQNVMPMESLPQVNHSSPQVMQNSFPASLMNSVPASSHSSSQLSGQAEVNQNGGNQLHLQKSAMTAGQLTPSLPQPVKFPGSKVHTYMPPKEYV